MSEEQSKEQKQKPKWFTPYWIAIFVSTVILLGIILPVFGHVSLETALFILIVGLFIEAFGFYVRIKQPSLRTNRIIYIVLFSLFFGCWFSIAAIALMDRIDNQIDAFTVSVLVGCFVLGGVLGDLIGRMRNYKGPNQYQP
jgi:CDP-diglyceride synthetase